MNLSSILLASIAWPWLSPIFTTAAPTPDGLALYSCVKNALIGPDAELRIITPSNDTYLTASSGVIL